MQSRLGVVVMLALAAACARSVSPPPPAAPTQVAATAGPGVEARLVAVDVFDTNPSTAQDVLERHGDAVRGLLQDGTADLSTRLRLLVEALRAEGRYAYVESALVTYHEPHARYLTIDIVDHRDVARRMPFRPRPTGTYPDPQGLIASWQRYEETFSDLFARGEVSGLPDGCPAFHCFGGSQHPALRSVAAELASGAPRHVDALATILRDDHRDDHRAAAAYLLAYEKDGDAVVATLLPALRDASQLVRNNAMRVLAEIAMNHPELDVPVEPVIEALEYPATTDRNKAVAILDRLLGRPGTVGLHPRVIRKVGPTLLALLRLDQPNNHDFAYSILKRVSGEVYGARDYAAWQAWLGRAAAK